MEEKKRTQGRTQENSSAFSLLDWVQSLVYAVTVGILIFTFFLRPITVEGSSMKPTLYSGDEVLVSDLFYHPGAGDIVVLRQLRYSETPLVKRVIALGGDTVDIDFDAGVVYVNGIAQQENYIAEKTYDRENFEGPLTVPEGCVFVMGDNRNASTDSRSAAIGVVDERSIIGKVFWILFSVDPVTGARSYGRFGGVE